MNSYIFIDGPVLWVVVGIIFIIIALAVASSLLKRTQLKIFVIFLHKKWSHRGLWCTLRVQITQT